MKSVDFLIIGGSAAGTTAADVIRSILPQSSIAIVDGENHEFYSRVLLPHYIRHKITRDQVFLKKAVWYQEKNIEFLMGARAKSLEAGGHVVSLDNGEQIKYGRLLITIGGSVIKLQVPGADLGNIFYLRTIEDADQIVKIAGQSQKAVIVGGGFVGLDFASCFKANDVRDITLLVLEDYFWQGKLDEVSSKVLSSTLEKNGIKILTNREVARIDFDNSNNQSKVVTKKGEVFPADVVGVGVGIRTGLSWLSGSGIKTNRGIVVNEYLETNIPDVYAAGDCAEFWDVIFERQHIMGNWANATNQGSAVGKTMIGERTVFETASSYSINFFDPPVGVVGGSCSFIGVTDERFADEIVSRGSAEDAKMTRIFIKTIGGVMRIVGATVVNNSSEVSPLTMAVKNKVDVAKYKDKLSDQNFDLKNILV